MREFDNIELTEEVPELAEKGIHKEYLGLIVELHGDVATVCFFNPHYHGERAFVKRISNIWRSLIVRRKN